LNPPQERLAKIGSVVIALLAIHFYPDYWIHILIAVPAALLVDYINRYSGKYTPLKWLQTYKGKFHRYRMEIKFHKAIKKENHEEYRKILIENALENVKSSDESKRKVGLAQLSQFGAEYAYEKLLDLLKNNEFDELHEKQVVETICTKIVKLLFYPYLCGGPL